MKDYFQAYQAFIKYHGGVYQCDQLFISTESM